MAWRGGGAAWLSFGRAGAEAGVQAGTAGALPATGAGPLRRAASQWPAAESNRAQAPPEKPPENANKTAETSRNPLTSPTPQIVVVDDGVVAEAGSHHQLLAQARARRPSVSPPACGTASGAPCPRPLPVRVWPPLPAPHPSRAPDPPQDPAREGCHPLSKPLKTARTPPRPPKTPQNPQSRM